MNIRRKNGTHFIFRHPIGIKQQYDKGESPIDYLHQAAICYATAIKNKPKDPTYHLQLGHVLEEKYYAEDMMALRKEVRSHKYNQIVSVFIGMCIYVSFY